ncbi:MAG: bifunctional folylpolyglutamate synthase/dihydrofolate synthase [Pirellulaceae bacterium]|nr:bifunctional folylpolyglutamate synthase/dihydrofolate synthase [Pirellulaceae bacterium]
MFTDLSQTASDPLLQAELEFLFERINYERTVSSNYPRHFKLETMRRLLERLGNPHQDYGIIHVAGTKGKGSVCKMIGGALDAAGIKTGVYSSPHIESICERISLSGQPISEAALAAVLQTTRQAVQQLDAESLLDGSRPSSFFEIITATGLLYFQQQGAEKVILEVGLGGRLDSTNICQPELCVITNISLDHTKQLGTTVDKIAREKAGIIKPGIPVVSGVKDPLAAREIRECCCVCNSDLMELDEDFHYRIIGTESAGCDVHFDTWGMLPERHSYRIDAVKLNAAGHHQVANAAIAVAAINLLTDRFRVSSEAIRKGMAGFSMIGRGEILSRDPWVVVDMAHNVASIDALLAMLRRLHADSGSAGRRRLIFASSQDKDLPGMMSRLLGYFDEVIFTKFVENPRGTDPAELLGIANLALADQAQRPEILIEPHPLAAWQATQTIMQAGDSLCVAGSAFLVAEMRPLLRAHFQGRPTTP